MTICLFPPDKSVCHKVEHSSNVGENDQGYSQSNVWPATECPQGMGNKHCPLAKIHQHKNHHHLGSFLSASATVLARVGSCFHRFGDLFDFEPNQHVTDDTGCESGKYDGRVHVWNDVGILLSPFYPAPENKLFEDVYPNNT